MDDAAVVSGLERADHLPRHGDGFVDWSLR
jgi:hypothetical protein